MRSSVFIFNFLCLLVASRDVFSHRLLAGAVDPLWMLLVFCCSCCLYSWIFRVIRTGKPGVVKPFLKLDLPHRFIFLKLGIITWLVYVATVFGVKYLGAAVFNVVDYGGTPLITLVMAFFMMGDKLKRSNLFGTIVALAGLILFFAASENIDVSSQRWWAIGLVLALVSSFTTSLSYVYQKKQVDAGLTPEEVLLYRFPIPALLMLVWCLIEPPHFELSSLLPLLAISFFGVFLPLWLMCFGFMKESIAQFSVYIFLIPIYTFILGPIIVAGEFEKLTQPKILLGTLLVFAGYLIFDGRTFSRPKLQKKAA